MAKKPTYEELEQEVNLLRLVCDNVSDLIWSKDLEDRFLFVNQAMCDKLIMCDSPDKALGKTDMFFAEQQRNAGYEHTFGEICVDSDAIIKRNRAPGRFLEDGLVSNKYFVLDVHKAPFLNEDGEMIGTVGCGRDVTKEKETEKALWKSEERYRSLVESSDDSIYLVAKDLTYLFMNRSHLSHYGGKTEKVIGRNYAEFHSENETRDFANRVQTIFDTGRSLSYEYQSERNGGYYLRSLNPVKDSGGETKAVTVVSKDVTQLKRSEEALRESEKQYRTIGETVPYGIWLTDAVGYCTYVSKSFLELVDMTMEQVQAFDWVHLLPPEDVEPTKEHWLHCVETGEHFEREHRFRAKDGNYRNVLAIGRPIKDDTGKIVKWVGLNLDITERKRAEEALKKSEKKYRTLLETTSEGYWLLNPEFKTIEVNQALCKMLGYSQHEIIGKTPFDFVDDENRKILIEQASKIPDTTHRSYEITLKKKNGQDLHICFNATTLRDKSGAVQSSFAFVTDITQRKKSEKERNRLSVAIEQASESVFITDRHGTIQYVNPAFERVTGYSRKDAIRQNPRILKSGKQDALFYKQMWDTLAHGHAWKGHFINRKKDGSLYEADATISPILDKSGNITHFVSIKRDVTREIELEKQLIQAQKMESIGTLAGGIAHEFNNILSIILGNAEVALDDVPDNSLAKECLDEIRTASLRASEVVRQILSFARKSLAEQNSIRISPIIKDSLRLLRASIPTTIEISQDISCEFDTVLAEPTQISQVVMNLCTNAAHAMGEHGGVLKVILKNVEFENQDAGLNLKSGRYVKLTVSDTGHGITPKIIDRIFDPYFTTKEIGKGTGLGLAVIHGIVKSYDGTITVTSEPGKGTVFEVLLPVIEAETQLKVEKSGILPTGTERILFVDDEQSLVKVARRILERLGYEVETKINPVEALELFRSRPDRFDLVITDMTMPQMTGKRLVKEILNIRADMPIILCTGYHEKISEEKAMELGIKAFVTKPFVTHNFALTVRKVLDEK